MPPVTAERSPPHSRMTGADSPVIAASLTEATPSITSPSLGIRSPASTSTISPGLSVVAGNGAPVGGAVLEQLGIRFGLGAAASDAACALPRPSATASAKFANSTVNQSQRLIWNEKPRLPAPVDEIAEEEDRRQRRDDLDHEHDRIARSCARIELPERVADRGDQDARCRSTSRTRGACGSRRPEVLWLPCVRLSIEVAGVHREMLDDGAERRAPGNR